ncbi:uncharacterized protein LOC113359832 [Papaver somniferum]|uniref:uncharacterized protein LOC113359832 n=1 Tax=Papaver somniferum TaxID=3469 RepID=UPI000E6F877A|nr:uncharacterized protein LOC113359832 [Papaver somniferum]
MPHMNTRGMKEKDLKEGERRMKREREREIQEVVRQNRHDNRVRQARLKRPMQQDAYQLMSEEILRELVEMREMMTLRRDGGRRQLDEAIEEAGKTPFARQIQLAAVPAKCILPVFTNIFDGSTCEIHHIRAYSLSLLQWEENDAVLCKYFPASLTGEALQWFEGLPVGRIRSFHHLQNLFLGQYIRNNMLRLGIEKVFSLRRRTNEILRSLTTRWRSMFSEMAGRVDERNLILAFINALFATDLLYTQIFRVKDAITMAELRKYQEEYIALEEKKREMESSQANQGKMLMEEEQNLVAIGTADQEELERQYIEKQFNNRGGNNKIQRLDNQPEGYGGQKQYYNQGPGGNKVVWEQIKMSHLNTAIDKIWEAVILMEDIPEPPNVGNEPPPWRRSNEFCAYHRFHGHTTSNYRNVKKIILRMIDQGKLNHFLVQTQQNLSPPPKGHAKDGKTGRHTYLIEVGAKAKNLYCNSIIHSFRNIEDFRDNVLSRVYARDSDRREILNLAKVSPLTDWQKQPISFTAEEVPEGGEQHESPLVVKLEINPKENADKDEEDDAEAWDINRMLIDPGSSVDILFYHTYKTMGGRDENLIPSTYKIYGFNGTTNKPKNEITM